MLELDGPGGLLVELEAIVVEELRARGDVSPREDEHAARARRVALLGLDGDAVGAARVVDPPRRVAADLGVDDVAALQGEIEGVVGLRGVVRVAGEGLFPGDALTAVLDDALAPPEVGGREHAPAMDEVERLTRIRSRGMTSKFRRGVTRLLPGDAPGRGAWRKRGRRWVRRARCAARPRRRRWIVYPGHHGQPAVDSPGPDAPRPGRRALSPGLRCAHGRLLSAAGAGGGYAASGGGGRGGQGGEACAAPGAACSSDEGCLQHRGAPRASA